MQLNNQIEYSDEIRHKIACIGEIGGTNVLRGTSEMLTSVGSIVLYLKGSKHQLTFIVKINITFQILYTDTVKINKSVVYLTNISCGLCIIDKTIHLFFGFGKVGKLGDA